MGYDPESRKKLVLFVAKELEQIVGVTEVISGGAQGFDQALAHAAIRLGLPLTLALPFKGMDAKWPEEARHKFSLLMDRAARIVCVSEGGYSNRKYWLRDQWMVDHADAVVALFDGGASKSGTGITVAYAKERGLPIFNLWDSWRCN